MSVSVPRLSVILDDDSTAEVGDYNKDVRRSHSRNDCSGSGGTEGFGAGRGSASNNQRAQGGSGGKTKGLGLVAAALLRAGSRAAAALEGNWQKRR
ncbi:hypothetical protein HK405_011785 [Cladochytrium tenue]|nr:hypothetical protein HK405_011785 [Cladochytrium tenue]